MMTTYEASFGCERRPGDCVPASLSIVTGVPYEKLPLPDQIQTGFTLNLANSRSRQIKAYVRAQPKWAIQYSKKLADAGHKFMVAFHPGRPWTDRLWLALYYSGCADGYNMFGHAVVMQHDKIVFDPAGYDSTDKMDFVGYLKTSPTSLWSQH